MGPSALQAQRLSQDCREAIVTVNRAATAKEWQGGPKFHKMRDSHGSDFLPLLDSRGSDCPDPVRFFETVSIWREN